MSRTLVNEYIPDYVSPPGDTLLETIEDLGMSQAELARRTGRPIKTINEIIQGKVAITPETALQFERVLDIPAHFWNNREQQYREALARLEEQKQLTGWIPWLSEIPLKTLIQRKLVPMCKEKSQQVFEALKFFGVASPDAWHELCQQQRKQVVAFRQSTAVKLEEGAIATWLREGELRARDIHCEPFDAQKFRQVLADIRSQTADLPDDWHNRLVDLCASAGVALVFVEELPRTGICGATQWVSPKKALIQLSLRYKRDDHLWFSLFHEAGHVLLHGKRDIFLERESLTDGDQEDEANKFARDQLIPPAHWRHFISSGQYQTREDIVAFADEIGIAPGIVVGRLQHDQLISFSQFNDLRRRVDWAEISGDEGEGRAE